MSKLRIKELIICTITSIALILSIVTNVFATDIMNSLNTAENKNVQEIENRGNNTVNNLNNTNNTVNNAVNNAVNNVTNNTRNNTTNNTNKVTTMPNTGVDYSILLIVAICGISAIYAYKKISDYKNF